MTEDEMQGLAEAGSRGSEQSTVSAMEKLPLSAPGGC